MRTMGSVWGQQPWKSTFILPRMKINFWLKSVNELKHSGITERTLLRKAKCHLCWLPFSSCLCVGQAPLRITVLFLVWWSIPLLPSKILNIRGGQKPRHLTVILDSKCYTVVSVYTHAHLCVCVLYATKYASAYLKDVKCPTINLCLILLRQSFPWI